MVQRNQRVKLSATKMVLLFALVGGMHMARPADSLPKTNAIWVFGVPSLPSPVTDAAARDALIGSAAVSGINVIYVSVYSSTPNRAGRLMYDDAAMADLIGKAHAMGMQVYAAYGASDWPSLGCSTSAGRPSFPLQRLMDVASYNVANPTILVNGASYSATFDGIILDVEPSGTPDFQALLGLYQCLQQQARVNTLGLSAAISAFWNSPVAFNNVAKEAYKQIVDLNLNNIVVMGYRNFAGSFDCSQGDGIICLDESLIAYANSVSRGEMILIGLDTINPSIVGITARETFFSKGQVSMNGEARSVSEQFSANNLAFGGFAIHNYRESFLNGQLPGWPASNDAFPPGGPTPQFSSAAVVNAASFIGGSVAPGELISIFGQNLGPIVPQGLQVTHGSVNTSLGAVRVLFDGIPAPMIATSSSQVTAIVPYEVDGDSRTNVQVEYSGVQSSLVAMPVAAATPGIFSANASGRGQGAILNQDYSYNSSTNPARAGSVIALYLTGAGQTVPSGVDGLISTDPNLLPQPLLQVTAQIGGLPARALYAGNSVGIVSGVMQVNVEVPSGLPVGSQPVIVKVGSFESPLGVTVAIQ